VAAKADEGGGPDLVIVEQVDQVLAHGVLVSGGGPRQFGPMKPSLLDNPIDLLIVIVIAMASFLWSVRAGGPTEELGEILAAQRARTRAEAAGS
jgi:hypothetical protein